MLVGGARVRLESAVGLLRNLAVTGAGGLEVAQEQRAVAVTAAEQFGDLELTARVIGAYDVPALWPRADNPEQAAGIVAAAERALAVLTPDGPGPARARLLATIALESRGTRDPRPRECARQHPDPLRFVTLADFVAEAGQGGKPVPTAPTRGRCRIASACSLSSCHVDASVAPARSAR
ncbi:hypothetical protein ACN268_21105 [Micromonospora sp. WMMD735]|uniref:hypothetical protein n=1 Tax=Micromonospora sp. WMMD735 TaxID=3404130 RepID=UPI003B93B63A